MSVATKYLERLKSKKVLVDLYTDEYEESDFGFIRDFNEDFLLLEKFDSESYPDGFSVFLRENITRVRWGGNEISSASLLIDQKKRVKNLGEIDLSSIETILMSVYETYGHVNIHIQDYDKNACFVGEIHEMDNESVVISEFGSRSALDRKFIMILLEDITRIDAEGQYEINMKNLFQEKVSNHKNS